MDANFRLSNRLSRSTNATDPNLNDGRAYMAPRMDYQEHIKQMEGSDVGEQVRMLFSPCIHRCMVDEDVAQRLLALRSDQHGEHEGWSGAQDDGRWRCYLRTPRVLAAARL